MKYCEKCSGNFIDGSVHSYDRALRVSSEVCFECYAAIMNRRMLRSVARLAKDNYIGFHRARARRMGLLATLTLAEWNETKEYFDHRCAYCRVEAIHCLEHFIPLNLGGPTVKWNCVPSCDKCNHKKRNHHPALVKLIPYEDIERVRAYLTRFL